MSTPREFSVFRRARPSSRRRQSISRPGPPESRAARRRRAFRRPFSRLRGSAPQRHEIFAFHSEAWGISTSVSLLEDVERNVEHDGAAPSRHHRLPRLARELRHHFRPRGLIHPLTISLHGRGEIRLVVAVGLLKRSPVELVGGYIAGYGQKGHRIEKGRWPKRSACSPNPARRR